MLCIMSPDICTNTLRTVQFTVMDEFCRLHNFGGHVGDEARDGACLGIQHDSLDHVHIGMHTASALCSTSTTGTSCRWTWRILKS